MKALWVLILCALPVRAEVELQSVRWQRAAREKGQPVKPAEIDSLPLAPGAALGGRLQAVVKLLNRGAATEGILLRYAVTAKIARGKESDQAMWAVPFATEEKRVPKIGANQFMEAVLDPTAFIDIYLKRLSRAGYWLSEVKIQVMLEPRKDAVGALQILERPLPFGVSP